MTMVAIGEGRLVCPLCVMRRCERAERACAEAVAAEREACATLLEQSARHDAEKYDEDTAAAIVIVAGIAADAIRARGAK